MKKPSLRREENIVEFLEGRFHNQQLCLVDKKKSGLEGSTNQEALCRNFSVKTLHTTYEKADLAGQCRVLFVSGLLWAGSFDQQQ